MQGAGVPWPSRRVLQRALPGLRGRLPPVTSQRTRDHAFRGPRGAVPAWGCSAGTAGGGAGTPCLGCGGGGEVDVHQILLLGVAQALHARQGSSNFAEECLRDCFGGWGACLALARVGKPVDRTGSQQAYLQQCCFCTSHGITLMLKPALALVSMNRMPSSLALVSPSSVETCLAMRGGEEGVTCSKICPKTSSRRTASDDLTSWSVAADHTSLHPRIPQQRTASPPGPSCCRPPQ